MSQQYSHQYPQQYQYSQYGQGYAQAYTQGYSQQQYQRNNYFVPGYGISRAVIQTEIRYFCGPDAIARPYTLHGRDGFLITTSGPPLTREQIDDLKESSREYEIRQAERQAERQSQTDEWYVNQPIAVGNRRAS